MKDQKEEEILKEIDQIADNLVDTRKVLKILIEELQNLEEYIRGDPDGE